MSKARPAAKSPRNPALARWAVQHVRARERAMIEELRAFLARCEEQPPGANRDRLRAALLASKGFPLSVSSLQVRCAIAVQLVEEHLPALQREDATTQDFERLSDLLASELDERRCLAIAWDEADMREVRRPRVRAIRVFAFLKVRYGLLGRERKPMPEFRVTTAASAALLKREIDSIKKALAQVRTK